MLDTAYATGERFIAEHVPVHFQVGPDAAIEERHVDFIYMPIIDDAGLVGRRPRSGRSPFSICCIRRISKRRAPGSSDRKKAIRCAMRRNRYRCKTGGWRWLSWVASPEGGKFSCSARDVTEDKARAAELRKVEDQLRQSQKMEAVGQLTGGIAHNFNNMLAGMMSGLHIVQRKVAAGKLDDIDRIVNAAHQSGERAASLIDRLMAFSRQRELRSNPSTPMR